MKPKRVRSGSLLIASPVLATLAAFPVEGGTDAAEIVAALDTQFQAAVKNYDVATIDRILADDFVLVVGSGKTFNKADVLREARERNPTYERQDELEQKVRVWGDTAVVTALLWIKATRDGKLDERKLWFSDVYVKTPKGWRYVLGQTSLPLPKSSGTP